MSIHKMSLQIESDSSEEVDTVLLTEYTEPFLLTNQNEIQLQEMNHSQIARSRTVSAIT